jgi:Family of unknown function (DUF5771)
MKGGKSTRRNGCPRGYILRKGYTRKYRSSVAQSGFTVRRKGKLYTIRPKVTSIHVPAGCIKDRGLPGKGVASGEGFGKLRKGDLIKYGYQYRLSDALRHRALKKAIAKYGTLTVYHKLDAVAKLSKRTAPDASSIFSRDRNWVKEQFNAEKESLEE